LIVAKPEKVIRWQRKGFKLFYIFKSWKKDLAVNQLILKFESSLRIWDGQICGNAYQQIHCNSDFLPLDTGLLI
jgi:hypothetical protein